MQLHKTIQTSTAAAHQALEKRIVMYMKNMRSIPAYVHLLQSYYGFIKPVEKLIYTYADRSMIPDIDKRMRLHLLENDLKHLGKEDLATVSESPVPFIHNTASALGSLYVLEGSTLGGKFIVQMIRQQLLLENGYSYFAGYGEQNPEMWSLFTGMLNQTDATLLQHEAVMAATKTFQHFDAWLAKKLKPHDAHE